MIDFDITYEINNINDSEFFEYLQTKQAERLRDFIIKLYEGKEYKLNDHVKMDSTNQIGMFYVLKCVFPNEEFYQYVRAVNNEIK
ncbi:hypothetical protein [Vibrio aestuarianus]|uniref:hypothetical protein n=1 Tax=Vibrio aestuarianus TaxID=28171 RepID=UPI00249C63A2|nr:hypothetical protein [Vibrio aestuarianus]WDS55451.1 hypothetical protein MCL29_06835 [Vibrio aestuarianus]